MARSAASHDFHVAVAPHGNDETVEALEQRVRRLEDAIAALQDTQLMEDRVVERVRQRVELHHVEQHRPAGGLIVSAARMLMPKHVDDVPPENPHPDAGTPPTDGQTANGTATPPPEAAQPGWLVVELYREIRGMVRMLADHRYRMSWTGKAVPLAAILAAVISWLLISGIPLVGGLLDRAVDLTLILLVYKAMSRELGRYRELLARIYGYR
jgi:hypothetical protein